MLKRDGGFSRHLRKKVTKNQPLLLPAHLRPQGDRAEEREGRLYGYEFTWGTKRPAPRLWLEIDGNTEYTVIDRDD